MFADRLLLGIATLVVLVAPLRAVCQPSAPDAAPATATPLAAADELSVEQARLADRYQRLEEVVGRLAELSAPNDPRRAKLLREAIAQSREQDIAVRFEAIVKLLQDERLSAAATNQNDLQKELDGLLALLLKADRDNELNSERDRVKKYLQDVSRLIREQKSVRARTQEGDELKSLGIDQERIAADTRRLGGDISKSDGDKHRGGQPNGERKESNERQLDKPKTGEKETQDKPAPAEEKKDQPDNKPEKQKDTDQQPGSSKSAKPSETGRPSDSNPPSDTPPKPGESQPSEGQPGAPQNAPPTPPTPGQPGAPEQGGEIDADQPPPDPADRASDRLKKAQQQMDEARKKLDEAERKGAAERQQQAIKELEIAKAELERVLRQLREEELERTLTQLAARFRKMLEIQTAVYDGTVKIDAVPAAQRNHDQEIESARLSREESKIVHEVDKALSLLHEEGSSAAFPEAIDQMRDDMRQVAERLAAVQVDKLTQSIEQDIIAALEETIAALDKSIKDLEKKRTPPGQQPAAGQPSEMPLVDKLAELKMIRSLQMRINKRTERYATMIQGDQAESPELLKSLEELADRQQRVYRATADLQQKRND